MGAADHGIAVIRPHEKSLEKQPDKRSKRWS
jgi:hypothetical protein